MKIYINSAVQLIDSIVQTKVSKDGNELDIHQIQLPDLGNVITANQARRLSKIVKASLYTATKALAEANCTMPDGILTATGLGCLEDTEKFLVELISNNEEVLSPTSFIQSTHNTISGQIAIFLKCYGINNTYTQRMHSWETALLDALMTLETESVSTLLVNAVDENTVLLNQFNKTIDTSNKITLGEQSISWVLSNVKNETSIASIENISFIKKEMNDEEAIHWLKDKVDIATMDQLFSNVNLPLLNVSLLESTLSMTSSAVYMQQIIECYKNKTYNKTALYINHFNSYHTLIVFNNAN